MDRKTLDEQIKNRAFERVYLFYGPERYILQLYEGRLIRRALSGGDPAFNISRFYDKADPASVYDACQMLPLGSDFRIVRVENCAAFTKAEANEAWLNTIKSVPESCILLFVQGEKIDGRLSVTKAVGMGRQVEFVLLSEEELVALVTKSTSDRGLFFEKGALNRLIYQIGFDAATLSQETRKLEAYVHPNKEITVEDVRRVAITNETANAFEITDDLIDEKFNSAFLRLETYLHQGGILSMIRGAVAYRLREMLAARLLLDQKKSQAAILSLLKGPKIARERTLLASKRVSAGWIERALCELAEGDDRNKSGKIPDERQAFELSLIRAFAGNK